MRRRARGVPCPLDLSELPRLPRHVHTRANSFKLSLKRISKFQPPSARLSPKACFSLTVPEDGTSAREMEHSNFTF